MQQFKDFFFGMSVPDREAFAGRAHTSRGFLNQVAYGNKQIELGMADVLVALGGGAFTLDELPLTENAQRQRRIRAQPPADGALHHSVDHAAEGADRHATPGHEHSAADLGGRRVNREDRRKGDRRDGSNNDRRRERG